MSSGREHQDGDCWAPTCEHCAAEEARECAHEWTEQSWLERSVCACGAIDPWNPHLGGDVA